MRSRRSWGIGDFRDLATFADTARHQGSRLLLVNPLHAATPTLPQQASPYSPTTRRYLNPLYIACELVPGARDLPQFPRLLRAGHALNEKPLIDRDRIFALKMRALDALYRQFGGDPQFDAFINAEGASLSEYGTFCALAEEFGGSWQRWPAHYRSRARRTYDALPRHTQPACAFTNGCNGTSIASFRTQRRSFP
jgi:4-alpha-glucanotransferase